MLRQDVEHLQTVGFVAAFGDCVSKHNLFFDVVHDGVELVLRNAIRLANGPASEGSSHSDNVLLRVASIDAECVKLQKLASVVFVQTGLTTKRACIRRGSVFARSL